MNTEANRALARRELNVLRRLLGRAEFRPQDVAALGLSKLQSAPGLGVKGLANVLAWLEAEGHPLPTPGTPDGSAQCKSRQRIHQRIDNARQLLEQWGWQVSRAESETPPQGVSE